MPEVDVLHPGVHVAFARGRMDEGQLARAMAAGELTSPQPFGNAWFFNLRITGTGHSYRNAHKEYVWRDPSIYMNQGFLDRCNGLPVVLLHPGGSMLDTTEYRQRNIGSILYPYLKPETNEVWGIARILDMPAAKFMRDHRLSTSPAVVFLPGDGNETIEVGGGKHLLIEGKPSLLDHVAVCEEGVWDKGGPPAGVDVATQETAMADEDRKDRKDDDETMDDAKKDADKKDETTEEASKREKEHMEASSRHDETLDDILKGIKVIGDRMDAFEDRFKDKKDTDEDKDRKDAAKKDDDPDHERKQAAELRELAAEEEREATKGDKKDRKDADEPDDRKDKDNDDEKKAEDRKDSARIVPDTELAMNEIVRKRGETDRAYATRVDAWALKAGANHYRKGDESIAAYCDRMDAVVRADTVRRERDGRVDSIQIIADSVMKLGDRMKDMERRFSDRSDDDESAFADVQARADAVYNEHGERAARPLRGESVTAYRIRLLRGLQKHSEMWRDSDIGAVARSDTAAFDNAERMIYADATAAARVPTGIPLGQLREVKKRLPSGVEISEFFGEPLSWMAPFMAPGRAARRLSNRPLSDRQ